jgi:hypothetical protein
MSISCKKITAGLFAVFQFCATQSICQTQSEIDKLIFRSVLKRQFTRILGGSSALPGNYIGLDIKDAKLTGSGTANLGDYSLITFNVNASVTEGIAPIFTNSKVNPSVGLETKFSFLNPFTDKSIITDDYEQLAIEERINQIFKFYEIEVSDIPNKAAYMDNIIALCQDSLSNMTASVYKT